VGRNPVVCTAQDPCHVAGICDPSTGACSNPAAPDGTACNADNNACTQNDTCQGGVCVPGEAVICQAQDACHVAGICDPTTGTCSNPPAPDGTACDVDDPCLLDGHCVNGACQGTAKRCPGKTACCRQRGNHFGQCVAKPACENSRPKQQGKDAAVHQERQGGHGHHRDRKRRGAKRR
jgi:hypothetical protein